MALLSIPILSLFTPVFAHADNLSPGESSEYTLTVSFDVQASQVRGQAKIGVKKGEDVRLYRGNLHILELTVDKQRVDIAGRTDTIHLQPAEDRVVEIRYVGTFKSPERPDGAAGAQGPSRIPSRVIDSRGIFLTGAWYPKPDRMCNYHLTVTLPAGYEAVSEAETVTTTPQEGGKSISFRFPHPLDALTLIATPRYQVTQDRFNDIARQAGGRGPGPWPGNSPRVPPGPWGWPRNLCTPAWKGPSLNNSTKKPASSPSAV